MTIREHLRRVGKQVQIWGVAGVMAVFAVVYFFYWPQHLTNLQEKGLLVAVAVVLGLAFNLVVMKFVVCPRCGTSFLRYRIAKVGWFSGDKRSPDQMWDACPKCGVSFDEPYRP